MIWLPHMAEVCSHKAALLGYWWSTLSNYQINASLASIVYKILCNGLPRALIVRDAGGMTVKPLLNMMYQQL